MRQQDTPQIHTGSMADIAFLLLIFFLVTTTIPNDQGLLKKLPQKEGNQINLNQRNVLEITLNASDAIQLEGRDIIKIDQLNAAVRAFIDNGTHCDFCNGLKNATASDHPTKAVIVFELSETASYGAYIAVHNEIKAAFNELRTTLAQQKFGRSLLELEKAYALGENRELIRAQLSEIKDSYPIQISEIQEGKNLNN